MTALQYFEYYLVTTIYLGFSGVTTFGTQLLANRVVEFFRYRHFGHILDPGQKSHRDFKIKRVVRETLYRRQFFTHRIMI